MAAGHARELKVDQRQRHQLPRMVQTLNLESKRSHHSPNAFLRKEPEVLRRRHQTPSAAGQSRGKRPEVAGCNDKYPARVEMLRQQGEGFARGRQVLDDVEQRNDIEHAKLAENVRVGLTCHDGQAGSAAVLRRLMRELDPGYIEKGPSFLEKKPIGAANIKQPASR
jgi:hypothetical protein